MRRASVLRFVSAVSLLPLAAAAPSPRRRAPLPMIGANDNRAPAGTLAGGVLTLHLDAVRGMWHPDGDDQPGTDMVAFAESGRAPTIPGPLVRVPAGTEVHATVHNALDSSIVVFGLSGAHAPGDTAWIRPGETRDLVLHATAAGTFLYQASYSVRRNREGEDRMLTGALVVDEPGAPPDRVFVLLQMIDTLRIHPSPTSNVEVLTINGRSWPATEHLTYDLGDTIRWRVINGSYDMHPMHLHGQYFDVLHRGTEYVDSAYAPAQVRKDVTERMLPLTTMYVRWRPEHAGNWLFHCHLNFHIQPHGPFVGVTLASRDAAPPAPPPMSEMGGLVLGVTVRGPVAHDDRPRRRLRLYVEQYDSIAGEYSPTYSYEREDLAKRTIPGAPFVVRQGEPLQITVVNRTSGPTSVHWHGLEIESYYDGVPAFSGTPQRMTPEIAPGDSFVVEMTPPRAGTFIYHSHRDDIRQQGGGLYGAFIVYPARSTWDAAHEVQLVAGSTPLDGVRLDLSARELRAGERYRLRMINITLDRPGAILTLRRGSELQRWDVIAKDGADLPPAQRGMRPARQPISIGETWDALLTPAHAGSYVFELRSLKGELLALEPFVVR